MTQLHFNYKDVFRALRLAFSAKKLAMMVWGWFLALFGYVVFSYVAMMTIGWRFIDTYQVYRIFPIPESLNWYGWIIWAIGVVYAIIVMLITATAVVKVTIEQLKGDDFYPMAKAFSFANERIKSIIMSPLLIVIFIISIVLCGLILSLIGKIPYFGELFTGIMLIPAFAASLLIVYLVIVFIFTLLYTPTIVVVTEGDAFDTIFEIFSSLNEQPGRLIWYSIIIGFLSKVGYYIFGLFARLGANVATNILGVFMGNKIFILVENALSTFRLTIPYWCPEPIAVLTEKLNSLFFGSYIFMPPAYSSVNVTMTITSILAILVYFFIILLVVAYGTTVWCCGATCAYLVIAKKKDDKNYLETKEEKIPEPTSEIKQ